MAWNKVRKKEIGCVSSKDLWALLAFSRFALAMWVVFAHTYNFGTEAHAISVPSRNALVAVYCFLAISGFSIRHSIIQRPTGYLLRRCQRIFPIHITAVIIALLTYIFCGPVLYYGANFDAACPWPGFWQWIACIFLLQAVLPVCVMSLFPAWSLSMEMLYYFSAPFLRQAWPIIPIGLVILSVVILVLRQYYRGGYYIGSDTYLVPPLCIFWAWLSGWIAYGNRGNHIFFLLTLVAGIIGILVDELLSGWFNYIVWLSVLVLLFYGNPLRIKKNITEFANYLGELTYPIYLLNYPIFFLLYNTIFKIYPQWNNGMTLTAALLVIAGVIYHFVDKPFRRKKSVISSVKLIEKILTV